MDDTTTATAATTASVVLAITPKFTSFLSIIGSSMIVSQVLRSKQWKQQIYQRLMLVMSAIDLLVSTVWFFANFFVPPFYKDEFGNQQQTDVTFSYGNQHTCDAQGFIVQFSIASVLYNASLSLYYVSVIRYGWKEQNFSKIEWFMHIVPLTFGLGTALASQLLSLYNPANWDCWIAPNPPNCKQTLSWPDDDDDNGNDSVVCERGDNAFFYRNLFFYGPLWLAIVFAAISMVSIYLYVRNIEEKSKGRIATRTSDFKYTQEVIIKSFLYVGSFFLTWIFPTITRVFDFATKGKPAPQYLIVLSGTFIPVQGFCNACVYFRPHFQKIRKDNPNQTWPQTIWMLIKATICGFVEDGGNSEKSQVSRFYVTTTNGVQEEEKSNLEHFREGDEELVLEQDVIVGRDGNSDASLHNDTDANVDHDANVDPDPETVA